MRKLIILLLAVDVGVVLGHMFDGVPSTAQAGGGKGGGEAKCAGENGDVNADGVIDISDGITILGHLFLGNPAGFVPLCATPAAPGGLPDTGQITCYDQDANIVDCASDTCSGQDGAYATGCSAEGRFVDNGDGTVTDDCTGLMWQKDTGNGGNELIWCDALAYCENLELAGHDEWRLPNVRELQSIVDYGRVSPAIDPAFGALSSCYWSSTSIEGDPADAWRVNFSVGHLSRRFEDCASLVRAVRSGP